LKGHQEQALVHNSVSSSELWHRRLAHLNYKVLLVLSKMVTGLLEFQTDHDRVCKGCALGKNVKGSFTSNESKSKGILDIIHSDLCGQMTVPSLGNFVYCVVHRRLFQEDMDLLVKKNIKSLTSFKSSRP
jgi:hypothetical protein